MKERQGIIERVYLFGVSFVKAVIPGLSNISFWWFRCRVGGEVFILLHGINRSGVRVVSLHFSNQFI